METWQVSLIAIGVGLVTFLLGQIYNQRNPKGLAETVESQQRIINNMQKEIQGLQALIKARRIKLETVIVVDEEVYIESQGAHAMDVALEPPTHPTTKRKNGFGGMRQ
jgi:hypothetical protein